MLIARILRCFAENRDGGTAVEMAVVLPVLSLIILGTIQAGWLLWSANTLYFAVEQAARCGAIDAANCNAPAPSGEAKVKAVAVANAMGLNMANGDFTVTNTTCGLQVTATYVFAFLMPFQTDFTVSIPAKSCYPIDSQT
jgi:Flp pilus assembly protein TadG